MLENGECVSVRAVKPRAVAPMIASSISTSKTKFKESHRERQIQIKAAAKSGAAGSRRAADPAGDILPYSKVSGPAGGKR